MLCEQCKAREATVHFSAVAWRSGDVTRHLCENCYPEAEAEREASFRREPKPLPDIDVAHITAQDYWDFSASAAANGADKPAFKHLCAELDKSPAAKERLAIEMLTLTLQSIEKGKPSWGLAAMGTFFGNSLPAPKPVTVLHLLENILVCSIELMAKSQEVRSDGHADHVLTLIGNTLRRTDPGRLANTLADLKAQAFPKPEIIVHFEEKMAESEQSAAEWRSRGSKA